MTCTCGHRGRGCRACPRTSSSRTAVSAAARRRSCWTSYRTAWPGTSTSNTRPSSSSRPVTPNTKPAPTTDNRHISAIEGRHVAIDVGSAGELPVPGLVRTGATGHRPGRVEPRELRRVVHQPLVLGGVVDLDATAQVDGEAPAVVARARHGGVAGRHARVELDLLG